MANILFENKTSYGLFIIKQDLDTEDVGLLLTTLESGKASNCNLFIFDFKGVRSITSQHYRLFTNFSKDVDGNIATVNMVKALRNTLIAAGLENVFNFSTAYSEAFAHLGIISSKSQKLDVDFLNPFIKATISTLGIQANTEIKLGKPFTKEPRMDLPMDIAGIIGITSEKFSGTLALCFSSEVFLKIYSNMLGEVYDEITSDIEDAAGEFTNIILGLAKADLNEKKGYKIEKAIPSVIQGKGIRLNHISSKPSVVIPFIVEEEEFYLDVCFDKDS